MTIVLLERSKTGVLLSCKAEGHAGFAKSGSDIVCSAITVLIRTTMQVLSETDGIKLKADTTNRGFLSFCVTVDSFSEKTETVLSYAGDFLETGLKSLMNEFPEYVEVRTKRVW